MARNWIVPIYIFIGFLPLIVPWEHGIGTGSIVIGLLFGMLAFLILSICLGSKWSKRIGRSIFYLYSFTVAFSFFPTFGDPEFEKHDDPSVAVLKLIILAFYLGGLAFLINKFTTWTSGAAANRESIE